MANRQLLIRGSAGQIAEVRTLLKKMGETFGDKSALSAGKLRLLSVDGGNAQELIERIKELWPALGSNELRFMPARAWGKRGPQPGMIDQRTPVPSPSRKTRPHDYPNSQPADTEAHKPVKAHHKKKPLVRLVADQVDKTDGQASPDKSTEPPIFIFSGPDGLYVSSQDMEALDQLQKLIDALQGGASSRSSEPKLTVFYLRNAQAEPVAERLNQLLAGATSSPLTPTAPGAAGGKGASPAPSGIFGQYRRRRKHWPHYAIRARLDHSGSAA